MEKPKPTVPIAKWGAACAPCAASKSRCIRSNTGLGSRCDRCQSLRRECPDQVHRPRKKRRVKSKPLKPQTEIDVAGSHLQPPNGSYTGRLTPSTSSPDPSGDQKYLSSRNASSLEPSSGISLSPHRERRMRDHFNSGTPVTCGNNPRYHKGNTTPPESDEALLKMYMTQLYPWFPFVAIPPGTTPAELASTRPFLWKVIRLVGSMRSLESMRNQSFEVTDHISDAVLMRSEKSIDLLQGIVVFAGYYQYFCLLHAQFHNLVLLATSMLADLGLHRTIAIQDRPRTQEERRLALGVWYMSSHAAMTFNRVEPMRYSKHIDQFVEETLAAATSEGDRLIVELIRIQHLADRIYRVNMRVDSGDELPGIAVVPIAVYRAAFRTELERLHTSVPKELRGNYVLIDHYDNVRLRINESAIGDKVSMGAQPAGLNPVAPSTPAQLDPDGIARLSSALKMTFEHMLSIPVCYYFYFPQPILASILYSLTILCRWVRFSSAKNQTVTEFLRQSELNVDVSGILERLGDKLEASGKEMRAAHGTWDNILWDLGAKKVRYIRSKLDKVADIVAIVGGEGLLSQRYHMTLEGNAPSIEGTAAGVGVPKGTSAPAEGSGLVFGGAEGDYEWSPSLFYDVDVETNAFFDMFGDWGVSWSDVGQDASADLEP